MSKSHSSEYSAQQLRHYLHAGEVPAGALRSEIADSWQRSINAGLSCNAALDRENLSKDSVADLQAQHHRLIEASFPEIKQLQDYCASEGGLIILADAKATLLGVEGDKRFMDSQTRYALEAGADWSEAVRGTNAIGTALIDGASVMINGHEHFLDKVSHLSCCSAPLFDGAGQMVGVLDLTSPKDTRALPPNLSLVRQAARNIENRLFCSQHQQQIVLSLHSRPEYLRSSWQGLLAMELDGHIQAINEQACQLLSRKREQLVGKNLEELFGIRPQTLLADLHRKGRGQLRTRADNYVCELLHFPHRLPSIATPSAAKSASTAALAPSVQAPTLSALAGQDARLQKGVRMGSRALAHELPVLIQGETGSGKEVLAKSLHLDSRRSQQPFVAVNCAAIPEGLIESELFGYREGAFTGSRKGGMVGKLESAQGGTLFLDEIGDMPLALQARLLRVLQERIITPLGAGEEIALDIAVICASHRDLKALVAEGQFREDLYYRLNGVCLRLPALKERSDKASFITTLLQQLAPDARQLAIEPALMSKLMAYHWPGNIRQLETVLRVAIAFMEPDEGVISELHLSDDFLEELNQPVEAVGQGALQQSEATTIQQMLVQHQGNISAAAQALGISRATLYRKLKR